MTRSASLRLSWLAPEAEPARPRIERHARKAASEEGRTG